MERTASTHRGFMECYSLLLSCSSTQSPWGKKFPALPSNTMYCPFLNPNSCLSGSCLILAGQIAFHGCVFDTGCEPSTSCDFCAICRGGIILSVCTGLVLTGQASSERLLELTLNRCERDIYSIRERGRSSSCSPIWQRDRS